MYTDELSPNITIIVWVSVVFVIILHYLEGLWRYHGDHKLTKDMNLFTIIVTVIVTFILVIVSPHTIFKKINLYDNNYDSLYDFEYKVIALR